MKYLIAFFLLVSTLLCNAQSLGPNATIRGSNILISASGLFNNIFLTNLGGSITGNGSGLTNITAATVSSTLSNNMVNGVSNALLSTITGTTNNTKIARTDFANTFTADNTFTNINSVGMISGGYASLSVGTGVVTVATSASTNLFYDWNHSNSGGTIGIETNAMVVVTNASKYRISFGALVGGTSGNTVKWMLFTNGVHCPLNTISFTCSATSTSETGFKEIVVNLPALSRISMRAANTAAANTTVSDACLNVKGVN